VALTSGLRIEIQDYNELALEINRLFSDATPDLGYYTSGIVLDTPSGVVDAGETYTLTSQVTSGDFLVATLGDRTLVQSDDYTITFNADNDDTITLTDAIALNAQLVVYSRTSHMYGWGQQASVHPIVAGDKVLSDESTLQAYIEANTNNLIDKLNITEVRIGGENEISRVAVGDLITPAELIGVKGLIDADVLVNDVYWNNDLPVITGAVLSYTRSTPWTAELTSTTRYTWESYDDMRYFFNAGCAIRAALNMTGNVTNAGYANWEQVVSQMGSLIVDRLSTTQTGTDGIQTGFGAFEFTPDYQTIFTAASPSTPYGADGNPDPNYADESADEYADAYTLYSSLRVVWNARLQVGVPSAGNVSIDISATLDDTSFPQFVEGTTTCNAGYTSTEDLVDNSATYSVTDFLPALTIVDNFTSNGVTFVNDFAITGITKANPAVVTVTDTSDLITGDTVIITDVNGMTELNGICHDITVLTATTFSLTGVNSTAYGTYTGPSGVASRKETLNWIAEGGNSANVELGRTQSDVTMSTVVRFDEVISGGTFILSDEAIYIDANECLAAESSVRLTAGGAGESSHIEFEFVPVVGTSAASNAVNNTMFRIHLIDDNESISITARNGGIDVPVTITPGGNVTVVAQTATSTAASLISDAAGSALVEITAAANIIRLTHTSGGTGVVHITDVTFEPNPLY
jgi:hypothetical protein